MSSKLLKKCQYSEYQRKQNLVTWRQPIYLKNCRRPNKTKTGDSHCRAPFHKAPLCQFFLGLQSNPTICVDLLK
jgi:hypothetical protein